MKCDKCAMEFTWKKSYDQHVSTCGGLNKFQCKDCENIYSSKKSLRHHWKKNHKTEAVSKFLLINYYFCYNNEFYMYISKVFYEI